jgi:hypothetical protein
LLIIIGTVGAIADEIKKRKANESWVVKN